MKVGIVGAGAVGSACMFAIALRGSARRLVLVNRTRERARGAVADLQYGTVLTLPVALSDGDYEDLHGAGLVLITAGINEQAGGATDRSDDAGRLRLLGTNADVYREIVPRRRRRSCSSLPIRPTRSPTSPASSPATSAC
jgi:L-lactate dehydrogenase